MDGVQATLAALSVAMLALSVHPFTSYPLSVFLLQAVKRDRVVKGPPAYTSVDLVMCAYNEGEVIGRKLQNLEAVKQQLPDLGVHVYSDGSTDGTNCALSSWPTSARVVLGDGRRGKSLGLNELMAEVASDLVIFCDCNVMIDPDGLGEALAHFDDPCVGLVNGSIARSGEGPRPGLGAVYYGFEQRLKLWETRAATTVMADGSLYIVRRNLFRILPEAAMEDAYTSLNVLCDGHRMVQSQVLQGTEDYDLTPRQERRRRRRIASRVTTTHVMLRKRLRTLPALTKYLYISHKPLRWMSGLNFCVAGLLAIALLVTVSLAAASVAVSALGAVILKLVISPSNGWLQSGLSAWMWTSIGFVEGLFGRSPVLWTPVRGRVSPERTPAVHHDGPSSAAPSRSAPSGI